MNTGVDWRHAVAALVSMDGVDWREAIIKLTDSSLSPVDWRQALLTFMGSNARPVDWREELEAAYPGSSWETAIVLVLTPSDSGPYRAHAVHFDGSNHTGAVLTNDALVSTDNGFLSFAMLVKFPVGITNFVFCVPWVCDPVNNYNTALQINRTDGVTDIVYGVSSNFTTLNFNQDPSPAFSAGSWICAMGMSDTQHSNGSKITKLFVGDVEQTASNIFDGGAAFNIAMNGLPFTVGNDTIGDCGPCDMADFRLWGGIFIDWSIEDNRRQIIDSMGKPVNPLTTTLPTPTILLSGNRTSFIINRGTGGPFILTGTLTDASTSPSD